LACEVWFYQLERLPLERTLPALLEKTLARGWRALVRTASEAEAERLDEVLWTYREDSFLPHGLLHEPLAEHQPVLLTPSAEAAPNNPQALFLLDGAETGDLSAFERCIVLFDGREGEALSAARGRYKALKDAGAPVSFWKENPERGWEKQG
jgi:DNA polymerase-3 subunit chi